MVNTQQSVEIKAGDRMITLGLDMLSAIAVLVLGYLLVRYVLTPILRLVLRRYGVDEVFTNFYAVTGRILGPAGAQLPQPAEVEVRIDDVSKADAPAQQVGAQRNSTATQFPIDFEATYDSGAIDERLSYALTVRITDSKGKLHFINTRSYPVLTRGHPTYNVEVLVNPVGQ